MKIICAAFVLAMFISGVSADEFVLTSSLFENGGTIPAKCAMKKVDGGKNLSPDLAWRHAPEGTKSFVLSCVDKHPVAKNWVHWMVFNIPAEVASLKLGDSSDDMPAGAVELNNSFGFRGYGGPLPPPGTGVHDYVFTIHALNVESIPIEGKFLTAKKLPEVLGKRVLGTATLTGGFER